MAEFGNITWLKEVLIAGSLVAAHFDFVVLKMLNWVTYNFQSIHCSESNIQLRTRCLTVKCSFKFQFTVSCWKKAFSTGTWLWTLIWGHPFLNGCCSQMTVRVSKGLSYTLFATTRLFAMGNYLKFFRHLQCEGTSEQDSCLQSFLGSDCNPRPVTADPVLFVL